MDRRKFLRNIFGAAAAVTIGRHLPVPVEQPAGNKGILWQLKNAGNVQSFKWMDMAMLKAQMAWMEQKEKQLWYGTKEIHQKHIGSVSGILRRKALTDTASA